ncbi:NmrA/HSCARG family protein [Streptomyces sp. AA0539]|uniref:NmrA/HSCARG family protein n=1 Tax=Streptomyces sp. AA0539 TaxID=1210045 RepID=UPI0003086CAA|nr:NmrA/HSCARG family protein [Streptomyces sp. AA0539]
MPSDPAAGPAAAPHAAATEPAAVEPAAVDPAAPVLVTGATGRQGGATARALLAAGVPVRALVRDPGTARARAVEALGATLVTGDLDDPASLRRAADGARAVFSVQMPDFAARGFDGELAQGRNLVEAARAAGVPQFVHTSVSRNEAPQWSGWAAMTPYFAAKSGIEDAVRAADFPSWTLIRPAFFMENFEPAMEFLFPRGVAGGLVSVIKPTTRLSLVAATDVGTTAALAVADPVRFHRVELDLAGDYLPMTEIAAILSRVLDAELTAPDMTEEQATAAGMPGMGASHELMNVAGQPARPAFAEALGIPVTGFAQWARETLRPAA